MKNSTPAQLAKLHIYIGYVSPRLIFLQVVLKLFQRVLYCRQQDVIMDFTSLTR